MAQVRKSDIELVTTNSKAADPGKFKDERKWPEWEKAFINYLSVIPRVSGIPLSFVVRELDVPIPGTEYLTFNERMINRAPVTDQYFIADTRRVHNLLVGFLQGENTENWIRNIAKYQDGRCDMIALRRHYAGEGNSTRRIADAKRIQSSLHYKTERALPFNKFFDYTLYLQIAVITNCCHCNLNRISLSKRSHSLSRHMYCNCEQHQAKNSEF